MSCKHALCIGVDYDVQVRRSLSQAVTVAWRQLLQRTCCLSLEALGVALLASARPLLLAGSLNSLALQSPLLTPL